MLPCTRYAITDISKFNILTACSYPIPYTVPSKPATPVHSLMTVSMPRSTARSWWRLPSISVLAVRWFPPKRLMVPTLSCACTTSRPQSFPRSLPGLPPSDTRCAWARRSPACFTAAAEVYLLPLPSTAYTHVLRLVSKP